jgi:hypothetical protein
MLIIQVCAYIVFSTPASIAYILTTFVSLMNTSSMTALRAIFNPWQQGIFFVSFFLYILSARIYRHELIKMLKLN